MATSYPGGVDSFGAPAGTDSQSTPVGGRTHSQSHTDLGDAVEAIETELGVNPSGASATVVARLDALDTTVAGKEAAGVAAALVDDLSGVTNAATARTNLGLGDAATKNTGTAAGTVAAGDDSRIVGALPASLVDAKGDLLTATADNTPARLAVGAEGDVLTVRGSASSGLAWAQPQPRNLLTVNQSSVETDTTGWVDRGNVTVSRSTAWAVDGTASLAATSNAAGGAYVGMPTGTSAVPVVGGRLYTMTLTQYAPVITSNITPRIYWYKANGTASATAYSATSTAALSTTPLTRWYSVVAPTDAAYASIVMVWSAAAAGEVVHLDKIGLWEGYGGTWALGGQPIQGVGERWDETVGRRCFRWNPLLNSGAGGEQVVYGDTGWRDVTPENSWTATTMRLRRVGMTVEFNGVGVNGSASSSATAYSLPSGFRPAHTVQVPAGYASTAAADAPVTASTTTVAAGGTRTSFTTSRWNLSWTTTDAWPTSLPGTASGSIPSA